MVARRRIQPVTQVGSAAAIDSHQPVGGQPCAKRSDRQSAYRASSKLCWSLAMDQNVGIAHQSCHALLVGCLGQSSQAPGRLIPASSRLGSMVGLRRRRPLFRGYRLGNPRLRPDQSRAGRGRHRAGRGHTRRTRRPTRSPGATSTSKPWAASSRCNRRHRHRQGRGRQLAKLSGHGRRSP